MSFETEPTGYEKTVLSELHGSCPSLHWIYCLISSHFLTSLCN